MYLTCPLLSLPKKVTLENRTYSLYQEGSCKTEDIVYVYICKTCDDFYIGRTMTPLNIRTNGHRVHFTDGTPEKSALLKHSLVDHPENYRTTGWVSQPILLPNPLTGQRIGLCQKQMQIPRTSTDTNLQGTYSIYQYLEYTIGQCLDQPPFPSFFHIHINLH